MRNPAMYSNTVTTTRYTWWCTNTRCHVGEGHQNMAPPLRLPEHSRHSIPLLLRQGLLSFQKFCIKEASAKRARCREGKVRRLSTAFGIARENIRASALEWAPMVSRWCWCHHAVGIAHSFGSECTFYHLGSGCSRTSHKVGFRCSRVHFRAT